MRKDKLWTAYTSKDQLYMCMYSMVYLYCHLVARHTIDIYLPCINDDESGHAHGDVDCNNM